MISNSSLAGADVCQVTHDLWTDLREELADLSFSGPYEREFAFRHDVWTRMQRVLAENWHHIVRVENPPLDTRDWDVWWKDEWVSDLWLEPTALPSAPESSPPPACTQARQPTTGDSDPNILDVTVNDGGAVRVCALFSLGSARQLLASDLPYQRGAARSQSIWSAFGLGRRRKRLLLVVHRGAATYLSTEFNSVLGLLGARAIPGVVFVPMAAWHV